jgi:hypothetical protein
MSDTLKPLNRLPYPEKNQGYEWGWKLTQNTGKGEEHGVWCLTMARNYPWDPSYATPDEAIAAGLP